MSNTRRAIVLIVVPPLAAAVASIVALLALAPRLPDPLATHWGFNGEINGTGSVASVIGLTAVFVPLFTAAVLVVFLLMSRGRSSSLFTRLIVATSVFVGVLIALIPLTFVIPQLGLSAGETFDSIVLVPWIVGVFVVSGVVATAMALLVPTTAVIEGDAAGAPAISLGAGEKAYWARTVAPHTAVIAIPIAALVIETVVLTLVGLPWWVPLIVDLVIVLAASTLVWRVVIDDRGARARALFGVPRFSIPLSAVSGAQQVEVHAMKFGGWGIRVDAQGRWGVIIRSGDAIEIVRRDKAPFVITVDDAATGAALLNGLARRA